ncbi:hypothetical protein QJS10_CPB19g01250 [Acorus calamus]|uniref:Leucine-rich repeat-containing N-terminal plant-type domain-containing protein n=1 Tax=Acorus calamus TaxID=4465 RepID=A0AAV9CHC4_ACOCL|nr:hypothetical protein QJS10_CPB19g01250 [Acorus calamus]
MGGSCGASVTLLIGVDVNGCVEEERRALLDIKHSLDSVGYDPIMLEDWVGGGNCCNWTGVECDAHRAVSKIDLSEVRSGFSQEWYPNASLFGQFTELKELDLGYNGIAGWVNLQDLCQLQDLQVLELSENSMKGNIDTCLKRSIPISLFNSSNIMFLDIRKNFFSGPVPTQVCHMQNLHILDLSNNHLSGTIPNCLKNITSWIIDSPIDYRMFEVAPYALFDISTNTVVTNLMTKESLDLSNNHLSGEIPSQLVKLHSLSVFRVSYNNLSGIIPYKDQFCTFNKSSFEGNPGLSGELIEKYCWSCTMHGTSQTYHDSSDGDDEDTSKAIDNEVIFYSFIAASFAIGFWGVIAVLTFDKNGRMKFFMAADDFLYACMDEILGLIKRIEKCICK